MSLRKELLPPPRPWYELELGKLGRPNAKGWASAKPPCHESKSGKSFIVNIRTGAYRCWGCGVRGGDIIDFLRWREGYTFRKACEVLGVWDKAGKPVKVPTIARRYLVLDYSIDGVSHRAEILDEPRSKGEQTRRFFHEAANRLQELRDGDSERFPGEEAAAWSIMADCWELLQMEASHG